MRGRLRHRCARLGATVTLVAALLAAPALAETYPSRAIKVVVPYSAGSGADVSARLTVPRLSTVFDQNVVIENRPGTGAIVGTDSVAKAQPDGYTLLLGVTQHAINPTLQKKLPYDTVKDFIPVSRLTSQPLVLAVSSSLPVKSVAELVAYVRARPKTLNYASTGIGTSIHLAGSYFAHAAGLEISHVPYTNASQATVDLGRGEVQMIFYTYLPLVPEVQSGRARILAITGAERSSWLPEVPTMVESGFPGFVMPAWQGVFAPAGTPKEVVGVLEQAFAKVMADPDVKAKLEPTGTDVYYAPSREFGAFVQAQIDKYREVLTVSGTKAE